jgi:hypothetical protein
MSNNIIYKNLNYLGRDFGEFRLNLINFAKNYFPTTYSDFNETDPGMLFIESAAYVGDVLSFYTDIALRENLLPYAQERENIIDLARTLGYKIKNVIPAVTVLDVYQVVPSRNVTTSTGIDVVPDLSYALTINENSLVSSNINKDIVFRTLDIVNFSLNTDLNPTEISIYSIDLTTNQPSLFLLKKQVKAVSGNVQTTNYSFSAGKIYDKIELQSENIIGVIDIVDSDGDNWYEVPYLSMDTVFETVLNIRKNDPDLYVFSSDTPYLLKMKQVPKRFVTRFKGNGNLVLQFGSGLSSKSDEELIPNPDLVGTNIIGFENYNLDYSIDPSNFLYTKTYGLVPQNTTLTVRYTTSLGITDNVGSGEITEPLLINITIDSENLNTQLLNRIKRSVSFSNPIPATGGKNYETLTEIRQNAPANFASQNRIVTREDFIIRSYALPSKYGNLAKVFVLQDEQLNTSVTYEQYIANPLALNLYVLSYNASKSLVNSNLALKENLMNYLNQFRILTDAINIKDAFIINIGIEFEIYVRSEYNSNEVLINCISKLKEIFNVDKWQINQPIYLSNLYTELDKVDGVQTVVNVNIKNLYDQSYGYSGNVYDIYNATKNGIIYPSIDPSIFEIKFLNKDIIGRVLNK